MENVFVEFLENKGLYDTIEVTPHNIDDLCDLLAGQVKLELYCKNCKEKRVYTITPPRAGRCNLNGDPMLISETLKREQQGIVANRINARRPLELGCSASVSTQQDSPRWHWVTSAIEKDIRIMHIECSCSMEPDHKVDFVLQVDGDYLRKIGQYPSVADLTFPEMDKYKKVLNTSYRNDLRRAIGLYADGIGAGSYVYLRRIFENILNEASQSAAISDREAFQKAKVKDKITMLKTELPTILTQNTQIYSILSKGIHELTEEECLKYFPVLKEAIFMILDQWEEMRRKKECEDAITKEITKIAGTI